jgi:hypothetical protein
MSTTTQERTNPQDEAKKIWDELDAEEIGRDPVAAERTATDEQLEQASSQALAEQQPAPEAGTQQQAAPSPDQQALLDRISGLESSLNQATQRLRNAEGHIGGLNSQLKQQLQTAHQVANQGGDAPSAKQLADAQRSTKAMENLRRDYPEFAEAMDAALEERLQEVVKRIPQQPQPVQAQPSVTADDLNRLQSEFAVEVRHPGWKETVTQPVFRGWLERQAREVQMLAASASPQDAVRLLDLYADGTKTSAATRTQRLSAAAAIPSGRSGSATRTKAVEDMSPQEYWRYLDELDRQKR